MSNFKIQLATYRWVRRFRDDRPDIVGEEAWTRDQILVASQKYWASSPDTTEHYATYKMVVEEYTVEKDVLTGDELPQECDRDTTKWGPCRDCERGTHTRTQWIIVDEKGCRAQGLGLDGAFERKRDAVAFLKETAEQANWWWDGTIYTTNEKVVAQR